jgi:hypothetical protein
VSESSHAIRLLYFVLVTKGINVFTADIVLCTVFVSLVVDPSVVLLLLLPACLWFLDSLPPRHTCTPPALHRKHGDQVNLCTSGKRFCECCLCIFGVLVCYNYMLITIGVPRASGCVCFFVCLTLQPAGPKT